MLTVRALGWLLIAGLALRATPYQRLAARWLTARGAPRLDHARAARIARAVHRAARVARPTCLTRALAGARLLARDGLDARVIIGVVPGAGARAAFAAHAWLAHGGVILTGAGADREYTPLCAIDAAPCPVFVTLA